MAEVRSLVLASDGTMKQAASADTQSISGTLTTTSGSLTLDPASNVELAADVSLVSVAGTGGLDLSASSGAFKTSTGALTLSGSSAVLDSTSTLVVGENATSIDIGSVGVMTTIKGDIQIDGAQTVIGETTFQQDATFEGNTTFGNDSAPDSVTFSANTTVDLGANKITNLADPTAGSQDAATAKYVDDGLGDKVAKAGDTMTGQLVINNAAGLQVLGISSSSVDLNPQEISVANSNFAINARGPFNGGGTLRLGTDAVTNVVEIGRSAGTVDIFAELDLNSKKITNLATPTAGNDAVNKTYADDHLGGVAYTFPAADGTADQVLTTDGLGVLSWADAGGSPAGSNTEIQFNNSGDFGASAALTFNSTTQDLVVGDGTPHSIRIGPYGYVSNPIIESQQSMNINIVNFDGALGIQAANNDLVLIGGNDGGGMSYLQTQLNVRLETQGEFWMKEQASLPAGVAGTGKLAVKSGDHALYFVDQDGQAHYSLPDGLSTIASGTAVTLDFDPALPTTRSITLGHNVTFSTDNLAAGRGMSIRLDNSAGGSARVLTFPLDGANQKWTWLGGSAPAQIDAGDVAMISLMAYGTDDTNIVAAWSYSESVQITGSGTAGQIAYFDGTRVIASEAGLKWDATNDRLNIGNADNSTHSANLRVGGTAHIGGEVWLDGSVNLGDASADVITVNGAMSLASGASFDGTDGTVDLPAQFSIDGSAVSANVTAANLNTLTGGSDASSLHTHSGVPAVVVALNTSTNSLAAGDVVCADSAAALTAAKADADLSSKSARVLGVVESAGKVMVSGIIEAKFVGSLTVALGEPVYLSQTAGLLTNVAPAAGAISEVGIIVDTGSYAGSTTCKVALQIKAPIYL